MSSSIKPSIDDLLADQPSGVHRWIDRLISLSPKTKNYLVSSFPNRGIDVMPGLNSESHQYQKLAELVVAHFEGEIADIDRLYSVAGVGQEPMSMPQPDNSQFREKLGLPNDFIAPWHRVIADAVIEAIFSPGPALGASIRRDASSMFPLFTREPVAKQKLLKDALRCVPTLLTGTLDQTMLDKLTEAGYVPLLCAVRRLQADVHNKQRTAHVVFADGATDDVEVARGYRGPMQRCRSRTAYGFTGALNYLLNLPIASSRSRYFSEYAFTWHHTGVEDIESKLRSWPAVTATDVSQFDQSYPAFFVTRVLDYIYNEYPSWYGNLLKLAYGAPSIHRYYGPVHGAAVSLGLSPFILDNYRLTSALPSGIALNPDLGKAFGTFGALVGIGEVLGWASLSEQDLKKRTRETLQGRGDMAILNAGDNILTCGRNAEQVDRAVAASTYFKAAVDPSRAFLGSEFTESDGWRGLPRLSSFFSNWFVAEHPVNSRQRPACRTAWKSRYQFYLTHPNFLDVYDRFGTIYRKATGVTLAAAVDQLIDSVKQQSLDSLVSGLDPLSARVLLKPELIYYAVDSRDIDPRVMRMIEASIPSRTHRALLADVGVPVIE